MTRSTIYLNLFNLDYNTRESDIREFFRGVEMLHVDMKNISKGVVDVKLKSKAEAAQIAEIGGGVSVF